MSQLNSSLPAWGAVAAHAKDMSKVHLRDLSAADPKRWQNFHFEHDTWLPRCSRQRITQQTLSLLFELARAVDLSGRIAAMFRGEPINSTEQRAVLHTALRSDFAGSPAIQAEVKDFAPQVVGLRRRGAQRKKSRRHGQKFRHVVNIASGLRLRAVAWYVKRCEPSGAAISRRTFVSNVDRTQLED